MELSIVDGNIRSRQSLNGGHSPLVTLKWQSPRYSAQIQCAVACGTGHDRANHGCRGLATGRVRTVCPGRRRSSKLQLCVWTPHRETLTTAILVLPSRAPVARRAVFWTRRGQFFRGRWTTIHDGRPTIWPRCRPKGGRRSWYVLTSHLSLTSFCPLALCTSTSTSNPHPTPSAGPRLVSQRNGRTLLADGTWPFCTLRSPPAFIRVPLLLALDRAPRGRPAPWPRKAESG